ncbi:hypothetical protein FNF27_00304 [Cafeteria roenbergensis]|uniref:Uncharacterized protein n=1 Tax=Cafeteria roenbergensis TaxID=33653 RepID=A0A5A8EKP3_CAFRO|nr:hypothetical protein FNF27_00304 [Cafeteria roenbergensis]
MQCLPLVALALLCACANGVALRGGHEHHDAALRAAGGAGGQPPLEPANLRRPDFTNSRAEPLFRPPFMPNLMPPSDS